MYFDKTQISAQTFAARLRCEILDRDAFGNTLDKLVIVGQSGIANASGRSVRINAGQSEKVLLHELMHLYGFIDEYPLRKIAMQLCNVEKTTQIGKNILWFLAVIKYKIALLIKTKYGLKPIPVIMPVALLQANSDSTNLELLDLPVPQLYLSILTNVKSSLNKW